MNEHLKEYYQLNLEKSAFLMSLCSIISAFFGLSFAFGAMGIILALVSRGNGELGKNAKIGLAISIATFIFGIASLISSVMLIVNNPDYITQLQQYVTDTYTEAVQVAGVF